MTTRVLACHANLNLKTSPKAFTTITRSVSQDMRPPHGARREAFEGASEVLVPDGVDGGIEEAVAVPEPEHDAHDVGRHLAGGAEGQHCGEQEEGQPAEDEAPDDEAQGARRAADAAALRALGVRGRDTAAVPLLPLPVPPQLRGRLWRVRVRF